LLIVLVAVVVIAIGVFVYFRMTSGGSDQVPQSYGPPPGAAPSGAGMGQ
jgi:hypothetical protein